MTLSLRSVHTLIKKWLKCVRSIGQREIEPPPGVTRSATPSKANGASLHTQKALIMHGAQLTSTLRFRILCGVAVISLVAVAADTLSGRREAANPPSSPTGDVVFDRELVSAALYSTESSEKIGYLQEALGSSQWIGEKPGIQDLSGKVVIVNFWTYSCVNALRVLPYISAWKKKYADQGLVVIGVHSPEFEFEKNAENVRQSVARLGLGYPTVLDPKHNVWRGFKNEVWPATYIFGADGELRQVVKGEGQYEQTERTIQALLAQRTGRPESRSLAALSPEGVAAAADRANLRSPEEYMGYARSAHFVSHGVTKRDVPSLYRAEDGLRLNDWGLTGSWAVGAESALLSSRRGSIRHRFHARDVNLVLAPSNANRPLQFRVTVDGKAPGVDHGSDVDEAGWGRVVEPRLYQLVRQQGPIQPRTFQIEFGHAGAKAYAFTFG